MSEQACVEGGYPTRTEWRQRTLLDVVDELGAAREHVRRVIYGAGTLIGSDDYARIDAALDALNFAIRPLTNTLNT